MIIEQYSASGLKGNFIRILSFVRCFGNLKINISSQAKLQKTQIPKLSEFGFHQIQKFVLCEFFDHQIKVIWY